MAEPVTLKHCPQLGGRLPQSLLPRYRRKEGATIRYVFAARLKRQPGTWLVVDSDWWGLMDAEEFLAEFYPSNEEARRAYKKATP